MICEGRNLKCGASPGWNHSDCVWVGVCLGRHLCCRCWRTARACFACRSDTCRILAGCLSLLVV